MAVISRGRPKIKSFAVLLSAALGLLMTNAASSPQVPEGGITIKEMMEKARPNTPESIYFVEQLARSNAVESIPLLEQKFKETQDEFDKDHIASALIRLEDRDNTYWDFLLNSATDVLDSDAPFPFVFDEHGRKLPDPAPGFVDWAKRRSLSVDAATEQLILKMPSAITFLGRTGSPKAIPTLRRALLSSNYFIEMAAANGLAQANDIDSVPMIIAACDRAPADIAPVIARPLINFNDSRAQAAVDKYLSPKAAQALREQRASGKPILN